MCKDGDGEAFHQQVLQSGVWSVKEEKYGVTHVLSRHDKLPTIPSVGIGMTRIWFIEARRRHRNPTQPLSQYRLRIIEQIRTMRTTLSCSWCR